MAFPDPDPIVVEAEIFASLPQAMRRPGQPSRWAEQNRNGACVDSFLEGPSFDLAGDLWFVDVAFGRIFRASPEGAIELTVEYDGQPNGLKIDQDGRILIADFRYGIMRLDPATGTVSTLLGAAHDGPFKGCNDLHIGPDGSVYFTDQGQTGLQDPTGRVFRWSPTTDRLECLIANVPSPNGLVLDRSGRILYLAVTRANAVWRLPLAADGTVAKAGLFLRFSGGRAGPDGLALTEADGIVVCQTGRGLVWVHDALGRAIAVVRASRGLGTTNCAFGGPEGRTLYITESDTGCLLRAELPVGGHPMASGWLDHAGPA